MDATKALAALAAGDWTGLALALDADDRYTVEIHGETLAVVRFGNATLQGGHTKVMLERFDTEDDAQQDFRRGRTSLIAFKAIHDTVCGHDNPIMDGMPPMPEINPLVQLMDQPAPDRLPDLWS